MKYYAYLDTCNGNIKIYKKHINDGHYKARLIQIIGNDKFIEAGEVNITLLQLKNLESGGIREFDYQPTEEDLKDWIENNVEMFL